MMKSIDKKIILSQENAESLLGRGLANEKRRYIGEIAKLMNDGLRLDARYLLGKGLATPKGVYIGKISEVLKDGLRLDTGAYILYDCCLSNYNIVKPKE